MCIHVSVLMCMYVYGKFSTALQWLKHAGSLLLSRYSVMLAGRGKSPIDITLIEMCIYCSLRSSGWKFSLNMTSLKNVDCSVLSYTENDFHGTPFRWHHFKCHFQTLRASVRKKM